MWQWTMWSVPLFLWLFLHSNGWKGGYKEIIQIRISISINVSSWYRVQIILQSTSSYGTIWWRYRMSAVILACISATPRYAQELTRHHLPGQQPRLHRGVQSANYSILENTGTPRVREEQEVGPLQPLGSQLRSHDVCKSQLFLKLTFWFYFILLHLKMICTGLDINSIQLFSSFCFVQIVLQWTSQWGQTR